MINNRFDCCLTSHWELWLWTNKHRVVAADKCLQNRKWKLSVLFTRLCWMEEAEIVALHWFVCWSNVWSFLASMGWKLILDFKCFNPNKCLLFSLFLSSCTSLPLSLPVLQPFLLLISSLSFKRNKIESPMFSLFIPLPPPQLMPVTRSGAPSAVLHWRGVVQ